MLVLNKVVSINGFIIDQAEKAIEAAIEAGPHLPDGRLQGVQIYRPSIPIFNQTGGALERQGQPD